MTETKERSDYEVWGGEQAMVKGWTRGVPVEDGAREQLARVAQLPFVHKWVAAMPDVHVGIGATVGSVIPTAGAIIPAAVGVDIGCGMKAVRTSLRAEDLPDSLSSLRRGIEEAVPHGKSWFRRVREDNVEVWGGLERRYRRLAERFPKIDGRHHVEQLGTLGGGNHFVEVCLDESDRVWFMLHSGSRGVGNRIGRFFIELAKQDMRTWFVNLPDRDLAYFPEGTQHFVDYTEAVGWAQDYARHNRECMLRQVLEAAHRERTLPAFTVTDQVVDCHHNYVAKERHFGREVWVTRKGAVRAGLGELGIIPGSMGAKSYIVRGRGNPDSFESCSHGAGRVMSRTAARARFTVEEHAQATAGVECRKDAGVLDETPGAYKDIDQVMHAQRDLVDVVHTLRQVVCVKG